MEAPEPGDGANRWIMRSADHRGREIRTVSLTSMLSFAGFALAVVMALVGWAAGQRSLAVDITKQMDDKIEAAERRAQLTNGALWEAVRNTTSRIDSHITAHDAAAARRR